MIIYFVQYHRKSLYYENFGYTSPYICGKISLFELKQYRVKITKRRLCRRWTYMLVNIVIIFDEKMNMIDIVDKKIGYTNLVKIDMMLSSIFNT
jgi:hypothetical protein